MGLGLGPLNSEFAEAIARLLDRDVEASDQAMEGVRNSLDAACRALEQTSSRDGSGERIRAFAQELTRAVVGHVRSGIEQLRRESDIRVHAAVAETKRRRHEVAALSARLEEAQTELLALRDEGAAGRGQDTPATREAERLRAEVTALSDRLNDVRVQADGLRRELETEREQSAARVLEIGQYRAASVRLEEARAELQALKKEREGARGQATASTAEVEQLRAEMAELSERVTQARTEEEGIRLELDRERKHSAALVLGLEQTRAALQALRHERAEGHGEDAATAAGDQLRAEVAELAERLNEVSTEAGRIRVELETERRQAASMVLEIGRARLAAERAERERQEMAAEVAALRQTLAERPDRLARPVQVESTAPAAVADGLARLESARLDHAGRDTPDEGAPAGSFRRRFAAFVRR